MYLSSNATEEQVKENAFDIYKHSFVAQMPTFKLEREAVAAAASAVTAPDNEILSFTANRARSADLCAADR